MKRVLLVSYVFPPEPSPGALRPGYLAQYLPHFGWEATILTQTSGTAPFPARVFTTGKLVTPLEERLRASVTARASDPHSPLRRRLRAIKELVLFPDATAPWIPAARKLGAKLLANERFDAIFSTALPASVHVVASDLARRSGLPWIADYRDPWAGNAYVKRGPIRSALERVVERRLLRRAASITTISRPIAQQLAGFHGRQTIHVIPNGYDPIEWNAVAQVQPSRFDLCYTGSMYDGKRSPDLLFEAIAQLRRQRDAGAQAARIHFFGPNSEGVAQSAARFGLVLQMRQHGVVPRPQAMLAQRSSAVLLLFLNMDERTASEMGSKYLEYAGAGRPILAFGPRSSVMRDFIQRNRLGWFASDVEEAKIALRAAFGRFSAQQYDVHPPPGAIPTARDLAGRFARVLDTATDACTRSIA